MNADIIKVGAIRRTGWIIVFAIFILIACNRSIAEEAATVTVQPKKCAVLQKGKKCYKKIKISFKAPIKDDYCLRIDREKSPLKCWKTSTEGEVTYLFNDNSSVRIYLHQGDDVVIAESEFTIAWVYSKRRRSRNHWRLF